MLAACSKGRQTLEAPTWPLRARTTARCGRRAGCHGRGRGPPAELPRQALLPQRRPLLCFAADRLVHPGLHGCRRGRVAPELLKAEFDEAWGVGTTVDRSNVRLLSIGTKAMMRDFNDMVYADLDYKYAANRLLED